MWTLISISVFTAWVYFKHNDTIQDRISKYDHYNAILQYNMEKAYDIIYKDRILIYSLEATALNDEEFKEVAKDFCILALRLMGPTIEKEMTKMFGDEETLYFNITEYFNSRFDEDEIRKTAQDNYIDSEVDEQQES